MAFCISAVLTAAPILAAEPELNYYDLGQRLVQLEHVWDAHPDAASRARAVPVLKQAVPQLLTGKTAEAAATLDRGRLLLESAEPTAAKKWAASLIVHPSLRLLDASSEPLTVGVGTAYPAGDLPDAVELTVSVTDADGAVRLRGVKSIVNKLPLDVVIPIKGVPEGDHILRTEITVGGKPAATFSIGISTASRLRERLRRLRVPEKGTSLDTATLRSLAVLFGVLGYGSTPETNFPAVRLLAEAEALDASLASGKEYYGPQRTGQFWLTIPTGASPVPVRIFVPEQAKSGKPLPVVVALHGAGGSENMFLDAYGYGLVGRLAAERGWYLVAPRAGGLFDDAPPVPAIIDELAKVYPIDKNHVFVVGHSMGAMQSVALAQQSLGRFAAIAPLGGGGRVFKPEVFRELPVFIGCGKEDFLLGGAQGLKATLEKAGATRVSYKEYPNVEHMLVVQEALPEVFKFFAAVIKH
jgi:predicted esterase